MLNVFNSKKLLLMEWYMKSTIVNRKNVVVILVVALIGVGAQGISYGQTADEYTPALTIELLKDGIKIGIETHGRFSLFNVTNRSTASTDSVRNSKWQRRDDSNTPWVDVPDSERASGYTAMW